MSLIIGDDFYTSAPLDTSEFLLVRREKSHDNRPTRRKNN
jgi:hypothetical protein